MATSHATNDDNDRPTGEPRRSTRLRRLAGSAAALAAVATLGAACAPAMADGPRNTADAIGGSDNTADAVDNTADTTVGEVVTIAVSDIERPTAAAPAGAATDDRAPTDRPTEPAPEPVDADDVEANGLDLAGGCWFLVGPADEPRLFLALDNDALIVTDGEPILLTPEPGDEPLGPTDLPTSFRGGEWIALLTVLDEPTSAGSESSLRRAGMAVEHLDTGAGSSLVGHLYCTI